MNRKYLLLLLLLLLALPACAGETKSKMTADEAIQLVADQYYPGDTSDLFVRELTDNRFEVKLSIDFGSGVYTTINAYLIAGGQVMDSLWDENGNFNDSFWDNADDDRAPEITTRQASLHGAIKRNITRLYPLDVAYNAAMLESDGSRAALVDITWEYTEKWKREIERYSDLLEPYYDPAVAAIGGGFYGFHQEGRELFQAAKQAWQAYRDAAEELNRYLAEQYEPTGGTKIAANQLKLYRDRAVELIMKCEQLGIS